MSWLCSAVPQDNDFPTDVDFKWAQDSYNVTQRNLDTWLFFGVFRARLWLLDQKWSYPGGFTGQQWVVGPGQMLRSKLD